MYAVAPEDDPDIEDLWFGDILLEEATGVHSGTAHHLTVYFNWCETLGLTPEMMKATKAMPETAAFEIGYFFSGLELL